MSFWTDQAFREPLRQNRWYLSFALSTPPATSNKNNNIIFKTHSLNDQVYALKSCTKPSISMRVEEKLQLNYYKYIPTTYRWNPITITMTSGLGNKGHYSAAAALYQIFFGIPSKELVDGTKDYIEAIYSTYGASKNDTDINLTNMVNTIPVMRIYQVNPDGMEIEKWVLEQPLITDINWGQLSYENDGFVDIEFKIQANHAELQTFFKEEDRAVREQQEEDQKFLRRQKELEEEAAKKRKNEQFVSGFNAADVFSPLQQVQKPIAQQQAEAQAENSQKANDIVNQSGVKQSMGSLKTFNEFEKEFNPDYPFKNQQNTPNQTNVSPSQTNNQDSRFPRGPTIQQSYSNLSESDRQTADRLEATVVPRNTQPQPENTQDVNRTLIQQQYDEARRAAAKENEATSNQYAQQYSSTPTSTARNRVTINGVVVYATDSQVEELDKRFGL